VKSPSLSESCPILCLVAVPKISKATLSMRPQLTSAHLEMGTSTLPCVQEQFTTNKVEGLDDIFTKCETKFV
jgi:hypothetical protein